MSIDWSRGRYEQTAETLEPVAREAVGRLRLHGGERVLDVACGTGNAAALVAAAGARPTGLDSAARLVAVATRRVPEGTFVVGDATAMPFADGAFEHAVSVFGVIFAEPAEAAIAELVRVVRPGGSIVVTSWRPGGASARATGLLREAAAAASPPAPDAPAPFAWHDPDAVEAAFARHGAAAVAEEAAVAFDAPSVDAVVDHWFDEHPAWCAVGDLIGAEAYADLRARTHAVLTEGNEDPGGGLRTTSRYLLTVARRA